uniref:Uncharacterized protein n=1 Tax=Chromera velia CCMP2878 TaxID=1169474 RepID=A0A0G4IAD7_9ALVE|eukprot:Cvel_12458.t1-p1 / transcript=Cvel_12458.t1 / gene=Cvel_12458 / organism=Chromera_velia_CCMP2878 / gene_product=Peroxisomal adenine nucleotide carrier 2, putative / transcript_product=Peroxisomal adenine nucleotide carrier 2, putative / location=Cvel_scaffold816:19995-28786(-) / protein_length=679 / sequence_SO=supercontig / SO=protein_coding / is_pseudo=false
MEESLVASHSNGGLADSAVSAVCAAIASAAASAAFYPLDSVIVHYQLKSIDSRRSHFGQVFADVFREGFSKIYQGWEAKAGEAFFRNLSFFFLYESAKRWHERRGNGNKLTLLNASLLAGTAGIVNLVVSSPLGVIATNVQTSGMPAKEVVRRVLRTEGFWGFFRALSASFSLTANGGISSALFDFLSNALRWFKFAQVHVMSGPAGRGPPPFPVLGSWYDERLPPLSPVEAAFVGGLAKLVATAFTYPYIRAKILLQCAPSPSGECISENSKADHHALQLQSPLLRATLDGLSSRGSPSSSTREGAPSSSNVLKGSSSSSSSERERVMRVVGFSHLDGEGVSRSSGNAHDALGARSSRSGGMPSPFPSGGHGGGVGARRSFLPPSSSREPSGRLGPGETHRPAAADGGQEEETSNARSSFLVPGRAPFRLSDHWREIGGAQGDMGDGGDGGGVLASLKNVPSQRNVHHPTTTVPPSPSALFDEAVINQCASFCLSETDLEFHGGPPGRGGGPRAKDAATLRVMEAILSRQQQQERGGLGSLYAVHGGNGEMMDGTAGGGGDHFLGGVGGDMHGLPPIQLYVREGRHRQFALPARAEDRGLRWVFVSVLMSEGLSGMYRGIIPQMVKSSLQYALMAFVRALLQRFASKLVGLARRGKRGARSNEYLESKSTNSKLSALL